MGVTILLPIIKKGLGMVSVPSPLPGTVPPLFFHVKDIFKNFDIVLVDF